MYLFVHWAYLDECVFVLTLSFSIKWILCWVIVQNLESALEYTASQNIAAYAWAIQAMRPCPGVQNSQPKEMQPHQGSHTSWNRRKNRRKSRWWVSKSPEGVLGDTMLQDWVTGSWHLTRQHGSFRPLKKPELNGICCPFQWSCGSEPIAKRLSPTTSSPHHPTTPSSLGAAVVDANLTQVGWPPWASNFSGQRNHLGVCQIYRFLSPLSPEIQTLIGKGERAMVEFTAHSHLEITEERSTISTTAFRAISTCGQACIKQG